MTVITRVVPLFFIFLMYNSFGQIPTLPNIKKPRIIETEGFKIVKDAVLDNMEKARKEYDETSFNYAVSLSDNAGLFENEQRFQKNQRLFLEVVKTTNGSGRTAEEKASSLNEAGEMFYAGNNFSAAEASFRQALALYRQSDTTHNPFALTLSNLGLLYHTTGRYSLSESYTNTALELRKTIFTGDHAALAASLNNLAVLYKDMGKYNESENLISKAVAMNAATAGKTSVPYALTLNNQAMLFQAMGRYPMAESLLKEAIEIAGQSMKEKSTNYVRLMVNLALLYQDSKKYTEAEEIYKRAIKIKENKLGTSHPDYAHLLNNLAALYMLMGKYDEVETLLKKSSDIYKKQFGEKHPSYAGTISNLGNYYRVKGRNAEAEKLLIQARDIRKETLGENHLEYVNSIESLGLLYWQMGKTAEASQLLKAVLDKNMEHIRNYFAPMSEVEKTKFWEKLRPTFLRFNSFVSNAYKTNPELAGDLYNYQLLTKALLLNATNKIKQEILNSGNKELIHEYKEWLDEKENLARLYTLSKSELAAEKINIDSLERICNEREKKLSAQSDLFSKKVGNDNITYKDIQAVLGPDEAAVEIISFTKFNRVHTDTVHYAALILTKETSHPKLVLLSNGNQLEKKYFNLYNNYIKQKMKDEVTYTHFWSKIDQEIGAKKTVYVSLDGIYNQLNLNTLLTPQGYLIDLKTIRLVTNTKEVLELKRPSAVNATNYAVLVGFPTYGKNGTVPPLPGTKTEAESIKATLTAAKYNSKVYLAEEATEQNLRSVKNPKILHIATHGFFLEEKESANDEKVFGIESGKSKENPMLRSGLMLADAENAIEGKSEHGILFAFEVTNLLLDKTDLVVLSACETGLGDVKNGEGVYGLQRAFQVAGAKSIIMSLWKVNDEATKLLISSFYKYYIQLGNKQSAFKKAQQELKTKYKEPYYWGAFVLVE